MEGRIYISGAFTAIQGAQPGEEAVWLDNDPHFWTSPPTWGICRTDYRRVIDVGDYVFFVLPARAKLPQMVYGYLKVKEKITHSEAFERSELRSKRMANKNPNGNIIVDKNGHYNRFDLDHHKSRFAEIRKHYVVGDEAESEFLGEHKIRRLAPDFVNVLNSVFGLDGVTPFDIIRRSGRRMRDDQVKQLLSWLRNGG